MRAAPTPKKKIRILIADREAIFRLGLRRLLSIEDDLRVVAQAENRAQALTGAKTFRADLLFVQLEIVNEGAGDLITGIRREVPRGKVVVTGSALSDDDTSRCVKDGASGVILKSAEPSLFVKCVRKVALDNETWLPKKQPYALAEASEGVRERRLRPVETLTRREKTIISYLMQGCRNREIARYLSITEQTVKNHLRMIYDKVGVSDRLELVLYAIHQRLELPKPEAAMAAHLS